MNEKPLLFSGEMVRAILDGRKTQTRRIVKLRKDKNHPSWPVQPLDILPMKDGSGWVTLMQRNPERGGMMKYALDPGDRFWVKETFGRVGDSYIYRADFKDGGRDSESFVELSTGEISPQKWIPSIFMPRKASRIDLEILSVRVERLQEITLGDVAAEGWPESPSRKEIWVAELDQVQQSGFTWYKNLWDSLNAKAGFGWDVNPWVWVIDFKRMK